MSENFLDIHYDLAHKFTHAQLHECSPSSRDGMSLAHQHYSRRMYVSLIQEAGMILKLPQSTICTAIMLCHRYYAVRSMVKNDKFVMAAASLLLAGKAEETPKSLRDVMRTCFEVRYSKRPKELDKIVDSGFMDYLREKIVIGERALVYAIGFDFDVRHPHDAAVKYIEHFQLENCLTFPPDSSLPQENGALLPKFHQLRYIVCTMLNDSYRCLVGLQYPAEHVAVGVISLALGTLKGNPPPTSGNKQWYEVIDVHPDVVRDIGDQLNDLYCNSQKQIEAVVAQRPFPVDCSAAAQQRESQQALDACAGSDERASEESEQAAFRQTPTEPRPVAEPANTALQVPAVRSTESPLHVQAPSSSACDAPDFEMAAPVVPHCSPPQNGPQAPLVMV